MSFSFHFHRRERRERRGNDSIKNQNYKSKSKIGDLVKSLKRRISVIPANPGSGPGQAPESRVPGENRDPDFEMAPDFRRDDVWTPVTTGVTTFYENINIKDFEFCIVVSHVAFWTLLSVLSRRSLRSLR